MPDEFYFSFEFFVHRNAKGFSKLHLWERQKKGQSCKVKYIGLISTNIEQKIVNKMPWKIQRIQTIVTVNQYYLSFCGRDRIGEKSKKNRASLDGEWVITAS